MGTYYIRQHGQVSGPLGAAELKKRAQLGTLTPEDEVSGDGSRWIPARSVGGLSFATVPPDLPAFEEPFYEPPSREDARFATDFADEYMPEPSKNGHSHGDPLNLEACRDCRELVSNRATTCPHCGCPLKSATSAELPPVAEKFSGLRFVVFAYKVAAILGLAVTACGILLIIVGIDGSKTGQIFAGFQTDYHCRHHVRRHRVRDRSSDRALRADRAQHQVDCRGRAAATIAGPATSANRQTPVRNEKARPASGALKWIRPRRSLV